MRRVFLFLSMLAGAFGVPSDASDCSAGDCDASPSAISIVATAMEDFFAILFLGRDRDQWFWRTWVTVAIYLAVCGLIYFKYTRRVMNLTMQPITGKWLTLWTIGHNLYMACLSIVLFFGLCHEWLVRAGGSMSAGDYFAPQNRFWVDVFYVSKAFEMVDTVLRLLSGRIRANVLVFQLYHHGTQPIGMYFNQLCKYDPSFSVFITNTLAHITAYFIYAGDAASSTFPVVITNKYISTTLRFLRRVNPPVQIAQFVVAIVVNYYVMLSPFGPAHSDRWYTAFFGAHLFYGVYFVWFLSLVNEYNKIKPASRAVNRRASFAASDVAYVTGNPYCKRRLSNAD